MTKHLWFHFEYPCALEYNEEIENEKLPGYYRYLAYFGEYLKRSAG